MSAARVAKSRLRILGGISRVLLLRIGSLALIVIGVVVILLVIEREPPRDLYWIRDYLGVPLPANARNIQYAVSEGPYNFHLYLTFQAPPESANRFADHFCYGILHSGYDPLNAINTGVPTSHSVFITDHAFHYSHAPNTPNSVFGNRCTIYSGIILQIKLDRSNPDLYGVTVYIPHPLSQERLPREDYDGNAIHPFPLEDIVFPLSVWGMQKDGEGFVLNFPEVCIETSLGYPFHWQPIFNFEGFQNASFQLKIDDQPIGPALISDTGYLTPIDSPESQIIGIHRSAKRYCFLSKLTSGTHTMTIDVDTIVGSHYSYSWDFDVPDDLALPQS
jgi:hypothetical protein